MRFPTMWYARSEPLLVDDCSATDRTTFGVSKLKRMLHRLGKIYACQNAILLEITFRGSIINLFSRIMLDWLESLKQCFINVSYNILIASLTLMAPF